MKRLWILAVVMGLSLSHESWAHPPTDVKLEFDQDQNVLHVTARHVTTETTEHYVRLITVTVNDGEPKVFRYRFQHQPSMVDVTLPVEAKPGDSIHVNLRCIKGGTIDATLDIPKEEKKEDSKESLKQHDGKAPVAP